jgi:3-oxoacyl-[acyl-carrier-protein] synthase-3
MICINKIEYFIPKKIKLDSKYPNIPKRFWSQKIGNNAVPRKKKNQDVIALCLLAFNKIKKKININKIGCIILCTQNPQHNGLPHNSAILQSIITKNKNKNIACLDISHGCAGYLYALKSAESFLKENEQGLIFTCDPYSKIIKNDFNTDAIFGDAATITIIQNNSRGHVLKKTSFFTDGKDYNAIINENNLLKMNGRKVLEFTKKNVPVFIENFIKINKIKNLKKIFLHQGSKFIVDLIKTEMKKNNYIFPTNFKNLGNTVSSSIPILLKQSNFQKEKKFIICGFGVGLSISIGYLEYNG